MAPHTGWDTTTAAEPTPTVWLCSWKSADHGGNIPLLRLKPDGTVYLLGWLETQEPPP